MEKRIEDRLARELGRTTEASEARNWALRTAAHLKSVPADSAAAVVAVLAEGLPKVSALQRQELAREIRSRNATQLAVDAARGWESPHAERWWFELGWCGLTPAVLTVAEALRTRGTAAALVTLEGLAERTELRSDQRTGLRNALELARRDRMPQADGPADTWGEVLAGVGPDRVQELLDGLGVLTHRPLLDQYLAVRLLDLRYRSPSDRGVGPEDVERLKAMDPRLWSGPRLMRWPPDLVAQLVPELLPEDGDLPSLFRWLESLPAESPARARAASELGAFTEQLGDARRKSSSRSRALEVARFLFGRGLQGPELPSRLARWWSGLGPDREGHRDDMRQAMQVLPEGDFLRFYSELGPEPRKDLVRAIPRDEAWVGRVVRAEARTEEYRPGRLGFLSLLWAGTPRDSQPGELVELTWNVVRAELRSERVSPVVLQECRDLLDRAGLAGRLEEQRLPLLTEREAGEANLLLDWFLEDMGALRRVEVLAGWLREVPACEAFLDRLARELRSEALALGLLEPLMAILEPSSRAALVDRLQAALPETERQKEELRARLLRIAERERQAVRSELEASLGRLRARWEGSATLQALIDEAIGSLGEALGDAGRQEEPEVTTGPVSHLHEFLANRWKKWTGLELPAQLPEDSVSGLVEGLVSLVEETEPAEAPEILLDFGQGLAEVCRMAGAEEERRRHALTLAEELARLRPAVAEALLEAKVRQPEDFRSALGAREDPAVEPAAHEPPDLQALLRTLQDAHLDLQRLREEEEAIPRQVRRRAALSLGKTVDALDDFIAGYLEFREELRDRGLPPVAEDLLGQRARNELHQGFRFLDERDSAADRFQVRTMGLRVAGDPEPTVKALVVAHPGHAPIEEGG